MEDPIITEVQKMIDVLKVVLADEYTKKYAPERVAQIEKGVHYLEGELRIREENNEILFKSLIKTRISLETYIDDMILNSPNFSNSFGDLLDDIGIDPPEN